MVLSEKGVTDWIDRHVDLFRGEQFSPEYIRLNPKAQTPTLVHDGEIVRESAIICEYIDDIYPDPSLRPASPAALAQMREWVKVADDHFYETVACLSFVSVFARTMKDKGPEEKEAHFRKQTDLGRVMRQRSCVDEGFNSKYVLRSAYNFMKLAADLEKELSDGRTWIMGDQFTLAEINYAPFIARIEALSMLESFLDNKPYTSAWWQRCKQRESFKSAEVGPAPGEESRRYRECGENVLPELNKLIQHIQKTSIYDLAS